MKIYPGNWLLAAIALAAVLFLLANEAGAGSGKPYEPDCSLAAEYGWFERYQCDYDNKEYITDYTIPQSYMVPKEGKLNLEIFLHRDQNKPSCDDDNFSKQGALVMKVCAGHYPSRAAYDHTFGWFGIFGGNLSNPLRIAHGIKYAEGVWGDRLDLGKGVTIRGASYGGTGSILQSYLLTELIDIVDADLAWTHFQDRYDEDPEVRATWGTYQPVDVMDAFATGNQDHVYYRVRSSSQDSLGRFNPRFIEACEKHKVACYVTWDEGNHSPEINHNPNLYTNPYMEWRKDRAKVIFTGSSANITGSRGHYNEGLSFAWFGNDLSADKPTLFRIPLTYQPRIIEKLPLMPDTVSFNVTIRDYQLEGEHFVYEFGNQSGEVWAVGGEITIHGLVLDSQKGYEGLTLRPAPKDSWELSYVESANSGKYALWDHGVGVGRIDGGFPESDIVLESKAGKRKVIHNCTTSPKICVTEDPRVSPDAKRLIYWEGIGDRMTDVISVGLTPRITFKDKDINQLIECKLWIYDLETDEKYPVSSGHCDRTADWIDNDTIVFASNRAKEFVPLNCKAKQVPLHGKAYKLGYQLYKADIKDKRLANIERLTPHHSNIMSPEVTSSGRILASALQSPERTCFNTSPKNAWYVMNMDTNGADQTNAEFAFHGYPNMKTYELVPTIDPAKRGIHSAPKAFRVVVELEKGLFSGNEYYRNNHAGSNGILHNWRENNNEGVLKGNELESAVQWGSFNQDGSGQFVPSSHYIATPWAESQDALVRFDNQGRAFGKVGASFAHTDGNFGFVWCRGMCYTHAIDVSISRYPPNGIDFTDPKNLGGEPPAHRVIALAKVPVVTDPFDPDQVEILSADPRKHRYAPVQIRTYAAHFGQDAPKQAPPIPPGKTMLISENVHNHQVFPIPNKGSKAERATFQGNLDEGTIARAGIDYVIPKKTQPEAYGLTYGNRVYVDVVEGRTEMEIIPDLPFQMFWEDAEGNEISRDHSLHSLRPGETRCCAGCHLHSEDAPKCQQ